MSSLMIENSTHITMYRDSEESKLNVPKESPSLVESPAAEIIHPNVLDSDLRLALYFFVKKLIKQEIKNSDDIKDLKQLKKIFFNNSLAALINFSKNYKAPTEKPAKFSFFSLLTCGVQAQKPRYLKILCRMLSSIDPNDLHAFQVERVTKFTEEATRDKQMLGSRENRV